MEYKNLFQDFIQRTKDNLEYIERAHESEPAARVYEVTQLINSLLGLIVFPKEQYFLHIPETPLEELALQGWRIPKVNGNFHQAHNLRQLMQYLRNAIAHSNLEFISDGYQLTGIRFWNCNRGEKNWQVEIELGDLRDLTYQFIDLVLTDQNTDHFDKRSECQSGKISYA